MIVFVNLGLKKRIFLTPCDWSAMSDISNLQTKTSKENSFMNEQAFKVGLVVCYWFEWLEVSLAECLPPDRTCSHVCKSIACSVDLPAVCVWEVQMKLIDQMAINHCSDCSNHNFMQTAISSRCKYLKALHDIVSHCRWTAHWLIGDGLSLFWLRGVTWAALLHSTHVRRIIWQLKHRIGWKHFFKGWTDS